MLDGDVDGVFFVAFYDVVPSMMCVDLCCVSLLISMVRSMLCVVLCSFLWWIL